MFKLLVTVRVIVCTWPASALSSAAEEFKTNSSVVVVVVVVPEEEPLLYERIDAMAVGMLALAVALTAPFGWSPG